MDLKQFHDLQPKTDTGGSPPKMRLIFRSLDEPQNILRYSSQYSIGPAAVCFFDSGVEEGKASWIVVGEFHFPKNFMNVEHRYEHIYL